MNFIEILEQHNIPYRDEEGHHHARSGWVQIDCPFCGKDSDRFHMGFSISGGYVNCWKCGGHRMTDVLMELLGIPFYECKKLLESLDITPKKIKRKKSKLQLPKGMGELDKCHIEYLEKRNYDVDELKQLWDIRGIGIHHELPWRIFIPIYHKGKMVSWTTRTISNNGVRYFSASEKQESVPHKNILYGEDYVRHSIIVCEGPLDVWKIGPGAVATFGTAHTSIQVKRISKYPIRTIIFDNEETAQKKARILCDILSLFPGETNNVIMEDNDPGSATDTEIAKIRKEFL